MLKGVLTESEPDVFSPCSGSSDQADSLMELESVEESDRESSVRRGTVEACWTYIKGILTANSMGVDRLHSLLALSLGCSSKEVAYISMKSLEGLLETKLKAKELCYSNGIYSLPPS